MRPPRVSRRPLGCQVQCRSSVLKRLLRSLVMVLAAVWLSGCADGTRAIGPPVARKKTFQEDKLAELVWYVERMAGPRLLDCGQHLVGNLPNSRPTPKVLEASLACGLNAQSNGSRSGRSLNTWVRKGRRSAVCWVHPKAPCTGSCMTAPAGRRSPAQASSKSGFVHIRRSNGTGAPIVAVCIDNRRRAP